MIESPQCRVDATSSSAVSVIIKPMICGVAVERCIDGQWVIIAVIPPGKTSAEEFSLQPGKEYEYRVVAICADGTRSDPSEICRARTPAH